MHTITGALLSLVLLTGQAHAATTLFDFETDDQITLWHSEGRDTLTADKKLERSESFAADGKSSMRFSTAAWIPAQHGGASSWPAFECKPPLTDWSRFDRLVMEIVNTTSARQLMALYISDSKQPTRNGLGHHESVPPGSRVQAVIDLRKGFADKGTDPADIHVMHIYTADPPVDLVVHLDRVLLLEPGEAVPPLPGSYIREVALLQAGSINAVTSGLTQTAARMREASAASPELAGWIARLTGDLDAQLADMRARVDRGDESVLDVPTMVANLELEVARAESLLTARVAFEKVRSRVVVDAQAAQGLVAGFATSMDKILPCAGVPDLAMEARYNVALAQNEREAFQLVVLPFDRGLIRVQVRAALKTPDGTPFGAGTVTAVPMGYVKTKATPPYGSSHVGWWPDPILTFLDSADVAKGDAQSFWVELNAPKQQAPGIYRGKLEVSAEGKPLMAFDLSVRVYGFAMPDGSPLPLAITFSPGDHPTDESSAQQAEWRKTPDFPANAWRRHRLEWGDFLADYYMTYDSLYHRGSPDFEILQRLHDRGQLGMFNLGYYDILGETPEEQDAWRKDTLARIKTAYETAKGLGLLDHAYIYGCDENSADRFAGVQRAAEVFKQECPGALVMTTTYDHSYGTNSVITAMDAWCPLTPSFRSELAEEVRPRGKQVWWYICCGPHHPFPNMFIEYPAIDGRVLMGAMSAKYRPDGFLYYQISIWNSRRPIEDGPYTDWDPRSWTTYHGDGSWTCVGPDGTPLPTIRLANFRDGLDDFAYFRVLEATFAKVKATPDLAATRADWLAKAEAALQVPEGIVKGLSSYTQDPRELYRWRDGIAELVEAADTEPAYPW